MRTRASMPAVRFLAAAGSLILGVDCGPGRTPGRGGEAVLLPGDVGLSCTGQEQCPEGKTCVHGVCVRSCEGDGGCSVPAAPDAAPPDAPTAPAADTGRPGEEGGGDVGPGGPGWPCDAHPDCREPLLCRRGVCYPECRQDRDCPAQRTCVDNRCREPVPRDTGPGGGDDANRPDTGRGGEQDAGPPCPPAHGAYGDRCSCREQCASLLCLRIPIPGREDVCTERCRVNADCWGIDLCTDVGGEKVCVPNDTNEPCAVPEDCIFQSCLLNPATGLAACTVPCAAAAGYCPFGMACGLGPAWVCVPVGTRCLGSRDCATGLCLPERLSPEIGYCTNDCRSGADCAAGWSCCPAALPDGGFVDVCSREGC